VIVQTAQMKLIVVSLMTHVLMTIVKMAHIGMATLAIPVHTVQIPMMIVIAVQRLETIAVVPVVAQQIQKLTAM